MPDSFDEFAVKALSLDSKIYTKCQIASCGFSRVPSAEFEKETKKEIDVALITTLEVLRLYHSTFR